MLGQPDGCLLEAVAFPLKLEQMAAVKQTIQDRRRCRIVAQQFSPILQRSI